MPNEETDDKLSRELRRLGFPVTVAVRAWWFALSEQCRGQVRGVCKPPASTCDRRGAQEERMLLLQNEAPTIDAEDGLFRLEDLLRCSEEYPWSTTPERRFYTG